MKRTMMRMKSNGLWRAAVICFLIAGATGVLYRFATVGGFPWGLQGGHVRHAHSHLMYFGWVTPAMMTFIVTKFHRAKGNQLNRLPFPLKVVAATVVLGLAVYPPFLVAGYGTMPIFGRHLPVASMVSAFNMVTWYVFAGWYVATTRGVARTDAVKLWDAALFFLILSTAGSWGRFVIEIRHIDAPALADTAVDFFLNVFSNGWMVVGVLALAFAGAKRQTPPADNVTRWAYRFLWITMPFASLTATPIADQNMLWQVIAQVGTIAVTAVLAYFVYVLWSSLKPDHRRQWLPVMGFFALMIGLHATMAFPPIRAWGDKAGLRVVYLHVLTLGVVTGGLVTAARQKWGHRAAPSPRLFGGAVLAFIVGFLALTPLWPWGSGSARLMFAAVASAFPLAAMVFALRSPSPSPSRHVRSRSMP